nr:TDP-4-oxo-6-deoxy-D-glucose transaminase [Klebsiella pneumoniae]
MIPFNAPPVVGTELDYMQSAMNSGKLCGDGGFTRRCQQWMEQRFGTAKALLTLPARLRWRWPRCCWISSRATK